jgi:hypothetical protein
MAKCKSHGHETGTVYFPYGLAAAVYVTAAIYTSVNHPHSSPTSRLEKRAPVITPPHYNWLANPYARAYRIASNGPSKLHAS